MMASTGFCSVCGRTVYVQKGQDPVCPVCMTPIAEIDEDETRAERVGQNEDSIRELNEGISRGFSGGIEKTKMVVLCECARTDCSATISIDHAAYEEVRTHSRRFIVTPGHETGDVEQAVERHTEYLIVEKVGEAGEVAEELDSS